MVPPLVVIVLSCPHSSLYAIFVRGAPFVAVRGAPSLVVPPAFVCEVFAVLPLFRGAPFVAVVLVVPPFSLCARFVRGAPFVGEVYVVPPSFVVPPSLVNFSWCTRWIWGSWFWICLFVYLFVCLPGCSLGGCPLRWCSWCPFTRGATRFRL